MEAAPAGRKWAAPPQAFAADGPGSLWASLWAANLAAARAEAGPAVGIPVREMALADRGMARGAAAAVRAAQEQARGIPISPLCSRFRAWTPRPCRRSPTTLRWTPAARATDR